MISKKKRGVDLLEPYAEMSYGELIEEYNSSFIHRIKKFLGFEEDLKLKEGVDG